jgi:hypothetical protein
VMRTEDLRPATRTAAETRAEDPSWPPERPSPGQ